MKLRPNMNPQEWKDLLNWLSARGALLTHYAETDNNGLFVDFKYALVEYKGEFYYLQGNSNRFYPFTVTRYSKVSPFVKHQNAYPHEVYSTDELFAYMNEGHVSRKFADTHDQRIFLTELYGIRNGCTDLWRLEHELAGYREKEILANLESITTLQYTHDYHVLRFHSKDGNYFDYETKSRRITG
jgi:hypothetical protein